MWAFQSVSHATGSLKKARVMTMLSGELGMIAVKRPVRQPVGVAADALRYE